jgi:hypothetical protein
VGLDYVRACLRQSQENLTGANIRVSKLGEREL